MNYIRFLFAAFLLIPFWSFSQNVKISGLAKAYANKDISALVYRDFITNTQKQITFSSIDSAGNFLLQFNANHIQYITLKIDKYVAFMYVQPDMNYEVIISSPDTTTYINPHLEQDVGISINLKSKTEINALTIDYDKRFDEFLTKEYKAFVSRSPQKEIDTFNLTMNQFYSSVNNPYFDTYRMYSIAALEEKTGASRKKLYNTYLNQKPVLYDHQEYFNFFNTFYKQYFTQIAQTKSALLAKQINDSSSYAGIMEILKQDEYLQIDSVRELVLIKNLFESYYDGTYKKESIVKMLGFIAEKGVFTDNKQVAQNCLNAFSKLKPGAVAPTFELHDNNGATYRLNDLGDKKYIYLFFYNNECTTCLSQMKIIASLKKQYNAHVQFVSISLDNKYADFKSYCAQHPQYNWLFLHDNTGKLKTDYEIKSLPACFLMDAQGKFVQVPASRPDEDLETVLFDLTKTKTKKLKVGDKANR